MLKIPQINHKNVVEDIEAYGWLYIYYIMSKLW